jgi:RNA polymerase sigma factor (sigma-70 family)
VDVDDTKAQAALAFFKAWERYPAQVGSREPGHFRAFLWRVLHDAVSDFIRKLKRDEKRETRTGVNRVLEFAASRVRRIIPHPAAVDEKDPRLLAEETEALRRLEEWFDRLPPKERQILEAKLADAKFKVIAAALHCHVRTVSRHWARLMAELRDRFGEEILIHGAELLSDLTIRREP